MSILQRALVVLVDFLNALPNNAMSVARMKRLKAQMKLKENVLRRISRVA